MSSPSKPVIGITLDAAEDSSIYSYAAKPWYALRKCYAEAVQAAGGIAVMLPYTEEVQPLLKHLHGLVIAGGSADIHPKFYGQHIKTNKITTNKQRALFEITIVQEAIARHVPILGICNGLQVINIVMGGTLIQHIPDQCHSHINHEQPHPKHVPSHIINIHPDTKLSMLAQTDKIMVNSTHHQAIDQLGQGLIISAKAEDGIIEAIEHPNLFVIGVQWHCEYLNSDLDFNLFKTLVAESTRICNILR